MSKIVLQSTEEFTANTTRILSIVGEVTFNEKNEIEVDEKIVEELLAKDFGFRLINPLFKEELKEEVKTIDPIEVTEEYLVKLPFKLLHSLLNDYPRTEWARIENSRYKIIAYLKKKLKNAKS